MEFTPSATDTKLLMALTRELTAGDAADLCGISYTYGIKRLNLLKKNGYIRSRQSGQKVFYSTVMLAETLPMFELAETRNGIAKEAEIVWYGELISYEEALKKLYTNNVESNSKDMLLEKLLRVVVSTLRVRSYNKAQNLHNQPPDEELLRLRLLEKVKHTKQELMVAEALLNDRLLWSGSTKVWKWISVTEPTQNTKDNANEAYKRLI